MSNKEVFMRSVISGLIPCGDGQYCVTEDRDDDGIPDKEDNCPFTPNPGQEDSDGDGIGDACDFKFDEPAIKLQSPSSGTSFGACSLSTPPIFSWTSEETFKGYEIQFSLDQNFSSIPVKVKAKVKGLTTQTVIPSATWKKVLMIPGSSGGAVYWRVEGRRKDGTTVRSRVFSLEVEGAEAVGNPVISPTGKNDFPNLSWENNCGVKFKVWFGSSSGFKKKVSYSFSVKNLSDNGGIFNKVLTSAQWKKIRGLVGDVTDSVIYWYVESWDWLNRYSKTGNMNFTLTD